MRGATCQFGEAIRNIVEAEAAREFKNVPTSHADNIVLIAADCSQMFLSYINIFEQADLKLNLSKLSTATRERVLQNHAVLRDG